MYSFVTSVLDGSKWSVWQTSRFTRGKRHPQYSPNWVSGGPDSRSAWFGEEEYLLPLPRIEPRFVYGPAGGLVTVPVKCFLLQRKMQCMCVCVCTCIGRLVWKSISANPRCHVLYGVHCPPPAFQYRPLGVIFAVIMQPEPVAATASGSVSRQGNGAQHPEWCCDSFSVLHIWSGATIL